MSCRNVLKTCLPRRALFCAYCGSSYLSEILTIQVNKALNAYHVMQPSLLVYALREGFGLAVLHCLV